jgi:hypothetical protein
MDGLLILSYRTCSCAAWLNSTKDSNAWQQAASATLDLYLFTNLLECKVGGLCIPSWVGHRGEEEGEVVEGEDVGVGVEGEGVEVLAEVKEGEMGVAWGVMVDSSHLHTQGMAANSHKEDHRSDPAGTCREVDTFGCQQATSASSH